MTGAYIDRKRSVPIWAALGAPLLGVPLIVGLLAVASPDRGEPANAPDAVVAEHVVGLESGHETATEIDRGTSVVSAAVAVETLPVVPGGTAAVD